MISTNELRSRAIQQAARADENDEAGAAIALALLYVGDQIAGIEPADGTDVENGLESVATAIEHAGTAIESANS